MTAARPYLPQLRTSFADARYPGGRQRQLAVWWNEIDRTLLVLVLLVMAIGIVAVGAASPSSARRLSKTDVKLEDLYFLWLHLRFMALGLLVMFATAMVPQNLMRRGCILLAAAMLVALLLVPIVGGEVNGARRWLNVGISFQPSEFLKPAFAVTVAWMLAWRVRDPSLPVISLSAATVGLIVALLMLQPNLGDAILFAGAWFVLVMVAGLQLQRIGILAACSTAALTLAYLFYDNARHRIDSFIGGGTAYDQVDLASRTLLGGGWTGSGFWMGTNKMSLPEAHTDYIFSVIGEEFGLLICALVVMLYLAIVMRVLMRMMNEENLFIVLATAGLIALFGGQAFINIMVNLQLFPSKGMTLPLISYGGSSYVAQCFVVGLLLTITRRNPCLEREKFDWRAAFEKDSVL
ncbi:cell division protein FtsW [Altererythrobacter xixiisoli]|uniref:Probable peptidoglycan glycosyltransferase FtsW n=1 Tax=Croceibacterium xixiisoli TaxID=1476466 RepID=A0A6I4TQP0_9SPHN|nr:FtsW/RodA/SpoVE family cell cycle protein [Croceibacterium xixiisoli]MXO98196.1 cell division protein FtsW [Croceibacterium xixiisoli]